MVCFICPHAPPPPPALGSVGGYWWNVMVLI